MASIQSSNSSFVHIWGITLTRSVGAYIFQPMALLNISSKLSDKTHSIFLEKDGDALMAIYIQPQGARGAEPTSMLSFGVEKEFTNRHNTYEIKQKTKKERKATTVVVF